MKRFFSRRRLSLLLSGTPVYVALFFGVLIFSGCGRRQPAADALTTTMPTGTTVVPAAANQPAYVPPAVTVGTAGDVDLKQLNHAYIGWIVQNHRRPKTFEEFVAMSGLQVPPAPVGKKYVIEKSGFINLVNR